MNYVDGIVAAVPNSNLESYTQYSKVFAPIFREAGALQVVDVLGAAHGLDPDLQPLDRSQKTSNCDESSADA